MQVSAAPTCDGFYNILNNNILRHKWTNSVMNDDKIGRLMKPLQAKAGRFLASRTGFYNADGALCRWQQLGGCIDPIGMAA